MRKILAIGPSPHTDGGGSISFRLLLAYLRAQRQLSVTPWELPVHRPLYNRHGAMGPLRHGATLAALLRALLQLRKHDAVLLFGTPDFCFTYGLALVLGAALGGKHCAMRLSGGRACFFTTNLPAWLQSLCLVAARPVSVIATETARARDDLPAGLQGKHVAVRNCRLGPTATQRPAHRSSAGCRGGAGRETVRFAFVTRADREKGEEVLMAAVADLEGRAAPALATMALHIYGRPWLRRPDAAPIATTRHGYVPNDRLRHALADNDVLLFPSIHAAEGHPGVVIEAFMAGLPVIGAGWPGVRELVEHGVNGLIVPIGDASALAEAMRLVATDHGLRRRLAAGAVVSRSRFDQANVLPELAAALGLVGDGRRAAGQMDEAG